MQQQGSKYDSATKEQALALIASGLSITKAAKQMGIPKSTVADWWNTQNEGDEDAIAARREARRSSIKKCGKIVDNALAVLQKKVTAAGNECKEMDYILGVLSEKAQDDEIELTKQEVESLRNIIKNYTGTGVRELSSVVKDIAQQQLSMEQQMLDEPDDAPELHVRLTLIDPAKGTGESA